MKKKHAVLSGLAALTLFDLVGAQAQAQVPQPVFNWTGFYVGVHTGYRWGDLSGTMPLPTFFEDIPVPFSTHANSGIFGFHAGYNYQSGNYLVGLEGDWSWGRGVGNASATFSDSVDAFATMNYRFQLTWSGTVRGRFGYISNNWLFYGTGGVAFQHVKVSGNGEAFDTIGGDSVSLVSRLSQGKTLFGYVVGAGVEGLGAGGWTWRIEYLFADFGRQNFGPVQLNGTDAFGDPFSAVSSFPLNLKVQTHTLRVGVTKLFQP